ncbi:hypothetical protein [Chryseobacterium indoltheticum]|uniref:hypothetical protein n=1 Tax=Chryseobacterium indoltheticum TaxID=254 RepID=UPI003F492AED
MGSRARTAVTYSFDACGRNAFRGVYAGNISFMTSGIGHLTEYFMWANYATTISMGACMPVVLRFKMRYKVRDKVVLYWCF